MKRDELLATLCRSVPMSGIGFEARTDVEREMRVAIAWLERLPAGCELVGHSATFDRDDGHQVYDLDCPHGKSFTMLATYSNPDDITKAAKR